MDDTYEQDDLEFQRRIQALRNGGMDAGHVAIDALFPPEFMREHTEFEDIRSFLNHAGIAASSTDFFLNPPPGLDAYVRLHSGFASYSKMRSAAVADYLKKNLRAQDEAGAVYAVLPVMYVTDDRTGDHCAFGPHWTTLARRARGVRRHAG